jgi:hypothetical protein
VHESAERCRPVLKDCQPIKVPFRKSPNAAHRRGTRCLEAGEHVSSDRSSVLTFLCKGFTRHIRENRALLGQRAPEAHLISLDLNVPDMTDLFDGGQMLARYSIPRIRAPMPQVMAYGGKVGLQQVRKIRECRKRRRIHVESLKLARPALDALRIQQA